MAAMSGAWLRRKVRHPWLGGPRRLTMYLATLDCATSNPSLSSSPYLQDRWKPAIQLDKEPAIIVREPDATRPPTPQNNQLMSKHGVLSLKPQRRLEWRGQDGQSETEKPDHSASLGDSIPSSTRIRFSVHTGQCCR